MYTSRVQDRTTSHCHAATHHAVVSTSRFSASLHIDVHVRLCTHSRMRTDAGVDDSSMATLIVTYTHTRIGKKAILNKHDRDEIVQAYQWNIYARVCARVLCERECVCMHIPCIIINA